MLTGTQKVAAPHLQLAELIWEEIVAQDYRPGDQLPSQQVLATKYRTSLITVKRALSVLKEEGLIYGEPGKGIYVNPPVNVFPGGFAAEVTIGLFLDPPLSPFFSGIASGVVHAVSEWGWSLAFANDLPGGPGEWNLEYLCQKGGAKGFVVGVRDGSGRTAEAVSTLRSQGCPIVMVSYTDDPELNYVGVDHVRGAYLAATHLVELGYESICYVTPEPTNPLSALRYQGFLQACEEAGLEGKLLAPEPDESLPANRYRSGYELGLRLVESGEFPEACFAFTDLVALGLMRALRENAVEVPQEVAVVGFDDIALAELAVVPLTTVRQPLKEIGYTAVDVLRRKLRGEDRVIRVLLEPELVVRESCGAPLRRKRKVC
ncbi:MAG: GntR family transcriptional regulator [candidate division KSB1 bacterium]|nr:GntR family transcriptional regulator [candidate division KSB1 bacterium]